MRDILEASIQRLLADHVTPVLLRESEKGTAATALWQLIEDLGLPHALVRESAGGSGLAWSDVHPLVMACGQHGLPLPLPETMLAAWLLDQTGLAVPSGAVSIVDSTGGAGARATHTSQGWRLEGMLPLVPWGRYARHAVLEVRVDGVLHLALVDITGLPCRDDLNLAREPRDNIDLQAAPAIALAPVPQVLGESPIRLYGAMLRCAQMAGAMERLVQQSIQYAGDRIQFGKAIGKFQAIQQQLAVLGCESAATAAGAAFAFDQAGQATASFAIAAAKVRAGEAAGKASSIAHATHGAIGFTYEHSLHFMTRRLWSWRSEYGHHGWWSRRIGAAMCTSGQPFWSCVTDGCIDIFPPTPAIPAETP